jgi:hypothetical protein
LKFGILDQPDLDEKLVLRRRDNDPLKGAHGSILSPDDGMPEHFRLIEGHSPECTNGKAYPWL